VRLRGSQPDTPALCTDIGRYSEHRVHSISNARIGGGAVPSIADGPVHFGDSGVFGRGATGFFGFIARCPVHAGGAANILVTAFHETDHWEGVSISSDHRLLTTRLDLRRRSM
jgi:hypothetical protein